MRVLTDTTHVQEKCFAATIGFFDGVHRGHQYLISQLQTVAKSMGLKSLVITFREHPKLVVQPDAEVSLLTTNEQKCALLQSLGVDATILLNFTREMSCMTAHEFMKHLHDAWGVKVLLIGYDHRFGHNRSENFMDYVRYGKEMGMQVLQAKEERLTENLGISSSVVRRYIEEGRMTDAADCLGRYYDFEGRVMHGFQFGRKMGFPTANLDVDIPCRLLPPTGVYVVWATVNGHTHKAMLNIGYRPTLSYNGKRSLEVHILNFEQQIYGETVKVEFVHRLRDEITFSSVEELVEQLHRDMHATEIYLK